MGFFMGLGDLMMVPFWWFVGDFMDNETINGMVIFGPIRMVISWELDGNIPSGNLLQFAIE